MSACLLRFGHFADRHVLWIPCLLSGVLRLAMLGSLPLLVFPDSSSFPEGRGYLVWAIDILEHGDFAGPAVRTPGYPAILAGFFALFGISGFSVLLLQHLQGLVTILLITAMARRIAGPRVALLTGVLAALDPWPLLFAHCALTEASMVFAVVLATAIVILPRSPSTLSALALGVTCGAMCLIRPTGQVLVPFLALALCAPGLRSLGVQSRLALCFVAGLAALLGPWLAFNQSRGYRGLAHSEDPLLFQGFCISGLLDGELMPTTAPESVREAFDLGIGPHPCQGCAAGFRILCDEAGFPRTAREAWVRDSLGADPVGYLRATWHALRWQLNLGDPDQLAISDEMPGMAGALFLNQKEKGERAPNFIREQHSLPHHARFAMRPGQADAPVAGLLRLCASGALRGLPHLPLVIIACAAAFWATRRRDWPLALVLTGSLAFVAAHAVVLYPWTRYSLPSVVLWYLSIPLLAVVQREAASTPQRTVSVGSKGGAIDPSTVDVQASRGTPDGDAAG